MQKQAETTLAPSPTRQAAQSRIIISARDLAIS